MGLWSALRNVFQPRYSISFDLSDQMAMIQARLRPSFSRRSRICVP